MPAVCYSSIKGDAMRVTRLDSAGKWLTGTTAAAVSKGFVNINLSANVEAGQEFVVKNAAGELCVNRKDKPRLKYFDLEIEYCEVDPELYELQTGSRVLQNYANVSAGFTVSETVNSAPHALEVWTEVSDPGDDQLWIYWLIPFVENGILGDITVENGPMSFTVTSNSKQNANWGLGPYNVLGQNVGATPGRLLAPVLAGEHIYHILTAVPPPTATCGYVAQNVGWVAPP